VLVWAAEAVLLGYAGGAVFGSRPLLAVAAGWTGALLVTGLAAVVPRLVGRAPAPRTRQEG